MSGKKEEITRMLDYTCFSTIQFFKDVNGFKVKNIGANRLYFSPMTLALIFLPLKKHI